MASQGPMGRALPVLSLPPPLEPLMLWGGVQWALFGAVPKEREPFSPQH